MKGYRFYKEYDTPADKRKDAPNGNVFAVFTDSDYFVNQWNEVMLEGYGSVFLSINSPCEYTMASSAWLNKCCKRISEAEARTIHPRLFERIEQ